MTNLPKLENPTRSALIEKYKELTRKDVPSGMSIVLLASIVAYESQAAQKGGLPVRLCKQLRSIAENAPIADAAPSLRPDSRLLRDWNGTAHVVDVIKDGFVYRGQTYKSLSAIAREITGARWSGPRFFGLKSAA